MRKQEVLTHKTPAIAYGISDALVIKDGDLYFLCEPSGDVPLHQGHGFGLYFRDCRYLAGYEVRLDGDKGITLLSSTRGSHEGLVVMTNPRIHREPGRDIIEETLSITWKRLLSGERGALIETFAIRNYGIEPAVIPLTLAFQASFEDIFQIRGLLNEHPGTLHPPECQEDGVNYLYEGADGVCRSLMIRWSSPPDAWQDDQAHFQLRLGPDEAKELKVTLAVGEWQSTQEVRSHWAVLGVYTSPDERDLAFEAWQQRHTRIRSDSMLLDRIIQRGEQDLHTLRSQLNGRVYFAAGIPWFTTLFGRDAAVACLQNLAFDPQVAEDTLRLLAELQGQKEDDWHDEQPGKIMHELRVGELANLGAIPHTPYYGSVDATPLFLILLAQHAQWSGSLRVFDDLRSNVLRALEWIDRFGDLTGDGYVDYDSTVGEGLINQGWKDSGNAILNRDGSLAEPPITLVEVQGYVYMAKVAIAVLFERAGDEGRARRLREEAQGLHERFNRDFWLEDERFYAMALQKGRRPVRAIGSNAGHALWAGIADPEKARHVVARLMAPDMYSGWGIRTLSQNEFPYNPIGYHLGTVWPHDNALIAGGMKRYGFDAEVETLFEGMFEAASKFDEYQVPELFAGFPRDFSPAPVRFPVACHPQAWGAGALPYMLWSMLGLYPEAFDGRLRVVRPRLPRLLDHLEIQHLQVGKAHVSLRFEREGDVTRVEVLSRDGHLDVVVEP
jgi:glycogen debranching enzyme